jgi:hypothetical protein
MSFLKEFCQQSSNEVSLTVFKGKLNFLCDKRFLCSGELLKVMVLAYLYFERELISIPSNSLSRWERVGVRAKNPRL